MEFRLSLNPRVDRSRDYFDLPGQVLRREGAVRARAEICEWSEYRRTPLRMLRQVAARAGVAGVLYKDEADRCRAGSFKVLGGALGLIRLLGRELEVDVANVISGQHRRSISQLTAVCASDGNHGRAVAWGAHQVGCRAVVYLPTHAVPERARRIESLGAEVRSVAGTYDDAVEEARRAAEEMGWLLIADTHTTGGGAPVTVDVMYGYTVLIYEALDQLPENRAPSHVFVQAGVGGLAAAIIATLWQHFGVARPTVVLVEPSSAPCIFEAASAGKPHRVSEALETSMDCLAAGTASAVAWPTISRGADAFMTIDDEVAAEAVRLLEAEPPPEGPIHTSPSGAAGLGGLHAISRDCDARRTLGLDQDSRVLLIGTEGPLQGPDN